MLNGLMTCQSLFKGSFWYAAGRMLTIWFAILSPHAPHCGLLPFDGAFASGAWPLRKLGFLGELCSSLQERRYRAMYSCLIEA